MIERRSAPRHETYKAARIAFGGTRPVTPCIVRNVSEGGACLTVERAIDVPDAFKLVFASAEPSRICYVMWRQQKRIGVAFAEENPFR
jgi:hypothetical protein